MERIVTPSGAPVNFEKVVKDIQDVSFENLKKRVGSIFKSLGVNKGISGDSLKAGISAGNITVSSGSALTKDLNYINLPSTQTIDNPEPNSSEGYAIILEYQEQGIDPVKALNAFVYDAVGSLSLQRKTKYIDSYELKTEEIDSSWAVFKEGLSGNEIVLGVIWREGGSFTEVGGYPEETFGDFVVADTREDFQLLIHKNIADSEDFVLKDDNGNVNIEGTTSEEFRVGIGSLNNGAGLPVSLVEDAPTRPNRLRVYSQNTNPVLGEFKNLVTLRWNWTNLVIDQVSGNTITFESENSDDEDINLNDEVIGKLLYFPNSDNSYEIITRNGNDITVEDFGSESGTCRIIDKHAKGYILSIIDLTSNEFYSVDLPLNFVKNPQLTKGFHVNHEFSISIRATTGTGIFTETSEIPNFDNSWKSTVTAGGLELQADAQGFKVTITGFDGAHNKEITYSTIDFQEIVDAGQFGEENLNDLLNNITNYDNIFREHISGRTAHISSGVPTRYFVAVRPLVNGVPANTVNEQDSNIAIGQVVSGGGGLTPEEDIIIQKHDIVFKLGIADITSVDLSDNIIDVDFIEPQGPLLSVPTLQQLQGR